MGILRNCGIFSVIAILQLVCHFICTFKLQVVYDKTDIMTCAHSENSKLYRSLVRSKLDYGCIIYGSARKSYLQMLDLIHNQGLRLALGAFRTSPVASLYVEADEPSLYSRREKLSLQYAIRLAANPSNPAYEVTFPPNYVNLYEQKPKAIKSFGIRISPLLESANIKPQNIEKHFTPNIPA